MLYLSKAIEAADALAADVRDESCPSRLGRSWTLRPPCAAGRVACHIRVRVWSV